IVHFPRPKVTSLLKYLGRCILQMYFASRAVTMNGQEPLAGVGKTALGVAYVRAQESRRLDRLFDDPYAQAFLDAAPGLFPATGGKAELALAGMTGLGAVFGWHAIIRTRFYDDYLTAASHAGCRQVVLLAAGLDTRAFRLDWPAETRLFE